MSTERMKKHNKAVGIEPYKTNRSKPKRAAMEDKSRSSEWRRKMVRLSTDVPVRPLCFHWQSFGWSWSRCPPDMACCLEMAVAGYQLSGAFGAWSLLWLMLQGVCCWRCWRGWAIEGSGKLEVGVCCSLRILKVYVLCRWWKVALENRHRWWSKSGLTVGNTICWPATKPNFPPKQFVKLVR